MSKKKKKNPTLTMKLWTESIWDWLAVARTNRKLNNENKMKMKPSRRRTE